MKKRVQPTKIASNKQTAPYGDLHSARPPVPSKKAALLKKRMRGK